MTFYRTNMTFTNALPATLSPSRLADFQTCPRRFQHASVDRIPQPATYATVKGRFVHKILEDLFALDSESRTIERARSFIPAASLAILTEQDRSDIKMDDEMEEKLLRETEAILTQYFAMEDPTRINSTGVEIRLKVTAEGVPMVGILDRLDREADGSLTIVDYKTGGLPNRNYDSQTFANTDLYAAMCEESDDVNELPARIRLYYVAFGEVIERTVTSQVVKARTTAAAVAWNKINKFYEAGEFPATPSKSACRFCAYQQLCKNNNIAVPE